MFVKTRHFAAIFLCFVFTRRIILNHVVETALRDPWCSRVLENPQMSVCNRLRPREYQKGFELSPVACIYL